MIDFLAWLGLVYDRKTVPQRIVRSRVLRTGDGTHPYASENCPFNSHNTSDENIEKKRKEFAILQPAPDEISGEQIDVEYTQKYEVAKSANNPYESCTTDS